MSEALVGVKRHQLSEMVEAVETEPAEEESPKPKKPRVRLISKAKSKEPV